MNTLKSPIGSPPGRMRATLTIRGNALEPSAIDALLGCTADSAHRAGEPRKRGAPYREGMWSITAVDDGATDTSSLVSGLLDRVNQSASVWSGLLAQYEITLGLCVLASRENQDFVLSPDQLCRLAVIGAQLWIDIYATDESTDD